MLAPDNQFLSDTCEYTSFSLEGFLDIEDINLAFLNVELTVDWQIRKDWQKADRVFLRELKVNDQVFHSLIIKSTFWFYNLKGKMRFEGDFKGFQGRSYEFTI